MKYHINPTTGRVGVCRAKVKCRFGGESGRENHFSDRAKAERAAEKLVSQDVLTGHRKPDSFTTRQERIREGLVKAGVTAKLPSVSTEKEMVEKWFGGDQSKYELILRISTPNSGLTDATRESVSGLVRKGAEVGFVPDLKQLDSVRNSATEETTSQVDLIEDLPEKDRRDLAAGRLRAF